MLLSKQRLIVISLFRNINMLKKTRLYSFTVLAVCLSIIFFTFYLLSYPQRQNSVDRASSKRQIDLVGADDLPVLQQEAFTYGKQPITHAIHKNHEHEHEHENLRPSNKENLAEKLKERLRTTSGPLPDMELLKSPTMEHPIQREHFKYHDTHNEASRPKRPRQPKLH